MSAHGLLDPQLQTEWCAAANRRSVPMAAVVTRALKIMPSGSSLMV